MTLKVFTAFGSKPEAIKIAPLIKHLKSLPDFDVCICITTHHRQMIDSTLRLFEIEPQFTIELEKPEQELSEVAAEILTRIEAPLLSFRPDVVLVLGDTGTTFSASLAAFYQKIPVAHVEGGLRTGTDDKPWPDYRKLTSILAHLHFVPTQQARTNLIEENTKPDGILVTGNTVIDALRITKEKLEAPTLSAQMAENFAHILRDRSRLVLITSHKNENVGEVLERICAAITQLAQRYPECDFVYPMHSNPAIQETLQRLLSEKTNVHLIKPLDYLEFVYLMMRSYLILTDSGGIQEEAPALGKPVLVMREITERYEAVQAGSVKVVGTKVSSIVENVVNLLENEQDYKAMSKIRNLYGDGFACERIAKFMLENIKIGMNQSE